MKLGLLRGAAILGASFLPLVAGASSHREAPQIAGLPRLDGTDFYMFRSYEPGRSNYVTFLANYIPFQDPQGGPNFYNLEENAVYTINIDNDGSGRPELVFEFRFDNDTKNLAVTTGGQKIPVPVLNIGRVDPAGKNLNVVQSYTINVVRNGNASPVENETLEGTTFYKPTDNIGHKSIPNYPEYAGHFIYSIEVPGCATPGRVFVGQRKEGFFINVGEIFDLVNMNPVGPRDAKQNDLSSKNVTSIALELPIACVTKGKDPVIGAFTTASVHVSNNQSQVSRLGMPLVNEVVIGLPDKDKFNASQPINDAQFLKYVEFPSFPVLLNTLFGSAAKMTGVKNLTPPMHVTPSEMMRLNTSIPPTAAAKQNDLGVLGGDLAGFPNGRRPYDDVVDITLRVAEGALCGAIGNCGTETKDPNNGAPYTDGVRAAGPDDAHTHISGAINPDDVYLASFPYLDNPLPGSPQGAKE